MGTSRPMGATKRTRSPADTIATTRNLHTRLLVAATITGMKATDKRPTILTRSHQTMGKRPTILTRCHPDTGRHTDIRSLPTEGTITQRTLTSPNHPTVRSMSHLTVATSRRNTDTSTSPRYTRPIRTTLMGIRAIEVSPTTTLPNANYI